MTDIIILSDIHGRTDRIDRVLSLHPEAEHFWFLGDGEADFTRTLSRHPEKNIRYVTGNCDFPNICSLGTTPSETVFNFSGHRILMTHGHKYGVKSGMEQLARRAFALDADIVLFGHTHCPFLLYEPQPRAVYYFNPGSLGLPNNTPPSYGILHTDGSSVLFSHGNL